MANEYLKRTPTSTGNRRVFTISVWTKVNNTTNGNAISNTHIGGSTFFTVRIGAPGNNNGVYLYTIKSGTDYSRYWTPADRDHSSWIHHIFAFDSTVENVDDRVIYYRNGAKVTSYSDVYGSVPQNYNFDIDTSRSFDIFRNTDASTFGKGQIFDYFFVDGQQLTPDVFGYYKKGDGYISAGSTQATDFKRGQWVPKAPKVIRSVINARGGFGVNGFYLPMNDSSNPGADFHCEPNSIIKLKGENFDEYPQPRNGAPTTSDAYVSQLRSDPFATNLVLAVPGIALENTNTELVTNGTFDTDISSWNSVQNGTGTITWRDGTVVLGGQDGTSANYADLHQQVTGLTIGTRYYFSFETSHLLYLCRLGTAGKYSQDVFGIEPGTEYKFDFEFEATATTLDITFHSRQNSGEVYFDNISLKEAIPVRDYSADIKGSGTNKTLTTVGSAHIDSDHPSYYGNSMQFGNDGTNGAGNTDVINVSTSSDFIFTGDVTMECWIYPDGTPSTASCIMGQWLSGGGTDRNMNINFDTSNRVIAYFNSSATNYNTGTSSALALNQWHHIAAEKHGSNFTLYVNGVAVGVNTNTPTAGNTSTVPFTIGSESDGSNGADYGFNGYIQDVRVYKGVAKYKGGFDVPKPYTPVGIESWRAVPDTTANNFATLNPLYKEVSVVLSNGNLGAIRSAGWGGVTSTIGLNGGKYYWEVMIDSGSANNFLHAGITDNSQAFANASGSGHESTIMYFTEDNTVKDNSTSTATGLTMGIGDILQLAFDGTTREFFVGVNGTFANSGNAIITAPAGYNYVAITQNATTPHTVNFGQNPSFSGQTTAGTYTDSNGKGLFKYAPPSGFLALCEDNLPTPAISDPGEHFKCVLYTGKGTNGTDGSQSIRKVGFQPDLIWVKKRDTAGDHKLIDSIRGASWVLESNTTDVEGNETNNFTGFNSDGFDLGANNAGAWNESPYGYVAWCWKAGGPAVTNNDGSITSQVSVNQTAGFSIVSYTGNGTAGATIGHGLGKTPSFIIIKDRTSANGWPVYHKSTGNTIFLYLNATSGSQVNSTAWNNTSPTSSVFTVGTGTLMNTNGNTYIAYCWAEIEGFSKFGSYVGNGSTDGTFVYCGFKPAWVMVRAVNSLADWVIMDSSRSSTNPNRKLLYANLSNIEGDGIDDRNPDLIVDFLSNGFKCRATNNDLNNAETYIFAAFAESPFTTANAK